MSRFLNLCLWTAVSVVMVSCTHPPAHRVDVSHKENPALTASPSTGKPVLEVPERVYNFGESKGRGVIEHDFKLFNHGTGDLRIEKILPS